MDYRAMAQSILQALPSSHPQPRLTANQSDDERIAQTVWTKMQLEISFNKPSVYRSLLLV